MYKQCQTEQSAARQREMEQGLLRLMRKMPYDEISVSNLCEEIGVPRKSFYRYFSNKDGALFALLDHTLLEFTQASGDRNGQSDGVFGDLERFFIFWYEHKTLLSALQRSRLSGLLVERATSHALHERLMPAYLIDKDPSIQQMSMTFTICGLLSMVLAWHNENYRETPQKMAETATAMLTKPLIQGK